MKTTQFQTRVYTAKNGASVTIEKHFPSGFYTVRLYDRSDYLMDKVSCDTYCGAMEYKKAFYCIAKQY